MYNLLSLNFLIIIDVYLIPWVDKSLSGDENVKSILKFSHIHTKMWKI